MTFLLLLPAMLSFLILAAHWLRAQNPLFAVASMAMCILLLVPRPWVARVAQTVLLLSSVVWGLTTYHIAQERMAEGKDWKRSAIILLSVGAFSLLAAALFHTRRLRTRYLRRGTNESDAGTT